MESTAEEIVERFLLDLEAGRAEDAAAALADDVVYTNVSLPTLRGRARVERLFKRGFDGAGLRFRVHFVNTAATGNVVLTERVDALGVGRFEQRFWVYGRFEVRDGKIAVWRDSFDWLDITVSIVRGLLGVAVPSLNRKWPVAGR